MVINRLIKIMHKYYLLRAYTQWVRHRVNCYIHTFRLTTLKQETGTTVTPHGKHGTMA